MLIIAIVPCSYRCNAASQSQKEVKTVFQLYDFVQTMRLTTSLGVTNSSNRELPIINLVLAYAFGDYASYAKKQHDFLQRAISRKHGRFGVTHFHHVVEAMQKIDYYARFIYKTGALTILHNKDIPLKKITEVACKRNKVWTLAPSFASTPGRTVLHFVLS